MVLLKGIITVDFNRDIFFKRSHILHVFKFLLEINSKLSLVLLIHVWNELSQILFERKFKMSLKQPILVDCSSGNFKFHWRLQANCCCNLTFVSLLTKHIAKHSCTKWLTYHEKISLLLSVWIDTMLFIKVVNSFRKILITACTVNFRSLCNKS